MDYKNIKILLDKYFDGQSSLSEEEELRIFFTNHKNIPSDLVYAQSLFSYLNVEKAVQYKNPVESNKSNWKVFYYALAVVASMLLIIYLATDTTTSADNDTEIIYAYVDGHPIKDKMEAIEISRIAFLSVSDRLGNAKKSLSYLNKFTEIESIIKN